MEFCFKSKINDSRFLTFVGFVNPTYGLRKTSLSLRANAVSAAIQPLEKTGIVTPSQTSFRHSGGDINLMPVPHGHPALYGSPARLECKQESLCCQRFFANAQNDDNVIQSEQGLPKPFNDKDLTSYRPNVLTTNSTPSPSLPPGEGEKSKAAFTLAEVLITLGIIGVVAAMTLPALIHKQQKQEATARLKKFYSSMQQAILLSENDNGPCGQWAKEERQANEDGTLKQNPQAALEYFDRFFKPYMKVLSSTIENEHPIIRFADGSTVSLTNGHCTDFVFDVNGERKPNTAGVDIFYFLLCPDDTKNGYFSNNRNFGTYSQKDIERGRAYALSACKTSPHLCSNLLLIDNWEFKDDYPW